MQPKLSVFQNALTNKPFEQLADVPTLVSRIQSDKYRPQTELLRSLSPADAPAYKRSSFVAVTWSGTFAPTRAKANLQTHSGLICIDLDKLPAERLRVLRDQLGRDMFTHVLFVSPSGHGLKVVVRIDYQQPTDHEAFFRQLSDYYRDCYRVTTEKDKDQLSEGQIPELDPSGKNVDRLCFLPHDANVVYHADSSVMPLADEYMSDEPKNEKGTINEPTKPTKGGAGTFVGFVGSSFTHSDKLLDRCLSLIRDARDGEKHHQLCKTATLAGGFIASGMLDEVEAVNALEDEVRAKPNVADFEAAQRTIRDQIAYGKTRPIEQQEPPHHERRESTSPRTHSNNSADPDQWPQPQPLQSSLLPVLPIEPDMIPEALRDWLTDIANRMKSPLDYTASAAVVMLSSLIGTRLAIKPKSRDDWTVVPNLWGAIIGPPSAKKTPSANAALAPLTRLVHEARTGYEKQLANYESEQITHEAKKKAYQSQELKRAKNEKIDHEVSFPEAIEKPVERRYMVNDATVEKLRELMNENPNGLLLFRDELTGLLASWERAGREEDRTFYLSAWNGNVGDRSDRISREGKPVKNVCLSLFGGIQPAKLLGYLQAATSYDNDGFVQRLQVAVFPDRPQWEYTDELPDKEAKDRAFTLIRDVANADLTQYGYQADEYNPFAYTRFDEAGQAVFRQWLTELENEIIPHESGLLEEHFAKYGSLMPSLALIFHVVNCIDSGELTKHITADAASMAVRWCAYLASHTRRIYGLLDTVSVEGAGRILSEIKRGKIHDGFKARDVVQKGWSGLTNTEQVEAALCELTEANYVRAEEQSDSRDSGGRPKGVTYRIHPELLQKP
jgi:hypothetical protein